MASTVLPNGIIIPEKYSRDWYNDLYHNWEELDNLLSASSPGDGTLTIQKNGTDVGTFSANQATDETINIEVPTSTSDLTNDSGFITEDNTKIPLAGSNQISGSLIPSTDGTVNLGGSSYQWNNAYIKSLTINGVVCGDILTHNVSEFVDVTSNQTIGGNKTFSGSFSVNRPSPRLQTKSTTYSSETSSGMTIGDIAFLNNTGGFSAWILHQLRDDLFKRLCFRVYPHSGGAYKGFAFDETCTLYPEHTNSALGSSTNKWKTINGVAPDELGLPTSTYTDVSSYITHFDAQPNTFTAPASGILQIDANGKTVTTNSILTINAVENDSTYRSIMPVAKGDIVTILTLASNISAIIYHLKGKV